MKNSVKKSLFPVLCTLSLLGTTTQINCMWKKVVAGALSAGTGFSIYTMYKIKKRREEKERLKSYLAPEHVQKRARELYDTVCANERKWWNIPGKIRDWRVRKFNHLDVYQGVNDIYFKKNNWCAYADSTGIHFPSESFTSITPLNDEQRGTLLHEVIHKYRGDFLQGNIERLNRNEFETEKLTTISLAKMEDWRALGDLSMSVVINLIKALNKEPQYDLGAIAGLATIRRTIPGRGSNPHEHLIEGHKDTCRCKKCFIFKAIIDKPMDYSSSMLWYHQFCKKKFE